MPFIYPQTLQERSTTYEIVKSCCKFVRLQRRTGKKKTTSHRIVIQPDSSSSNVVLVAICSSPSDQLSSEWKYIEEELEGLLPSFQGPNADDELVQWIVSHFNFLYSHKHESEENSQDSTTSSTETEQKQGLSWEFIPSEYLYIAFMNVLISVLFNLFPTLCFILLLFSFNFILLKTDLKSQLFISQTSKTQHSETSSSPSDFAEIPLGQTLVESSDEETAPIRVEEANMNMFTAKDETKTQRMQQLGMWRKIPAFNLNVRGPTYLSDKIKIPSEPFIYQVFAVDVYKSPFKMEDAFHLFEIPAISPSKPSCGLPQLLVVNVMAPLCAPSLFGKQEDGETFSTIIFATLSPEFNTTELSKEIPPSVKILKRLWQGDDSVLSQLKAFARVINPSQLGLGRLIGGIVEKYNGNPFVVPCASSSVKRGDNYLEIDVDMHQFGSLPKHAFYQLKHILPKIMVDFAFVLQGKSQEELPERLLAGFRCFGVQNVNAAPFPKMFQ